MADYTPGYNQLLQYANKRDKDRIYADEWNNTIKILATQQNLLNAGLGQVDEKILEVVQATQQAKIALHKTPPENPVEGQVLFFEDE